MAKTRRIIAKFRKTTKLRDQLSSTINISFQTLMPVGFTIPNYLQLKILQEHQDPKSAFVLAV
jgi:hypothetical protein